MSETLEPLFDMIVREVRRREQGAGGGAVAEGLLLDLIVRQVKRGV